MPAPLHRLCRWLGLCLAMAALAPPSLAEEPPALSRDEALAWLARVNSAASQSSYRGTMVFSAGGVMASSRVAHVCVGDQVYERLEALDGNLQRVYRHNDTVHTVWPLRQTVIVEQQTAAPALVSTRRRVEPAALEHYRLRLTGAKSHVAGRPVRKLVLEPLDEWRFAQRLWVDEASGLLLRSDVLAPDGHVLESSAFIEVQTGGSAADVAGLMQGMTPSGYTVRPSQRELVEFAAQGWSLEPPVAGFRALGCLRRPVPGQTGAEVALQVVFTDGLSFVSVFVEPYVASRHTQALAAELGAMHTVMQRREDHWVTAMGDVPRRTLEAFIGALQQRP